MPKIKKIGLNDPGTVSIEWQKTLESWISSKELVPITGAGVSANLKMPCWSTLADKLCDTLEKIDKNAPIDEIRNESDLLLKTFRCTHRIKKVSNKRDDIQQALHNALYDKVSINRNSVLWLECIYQLSMLSGFHITFNFDDIFEIYSNLIHDKKAVISEFSRKSRRLNGQIDSFHIHGLIPYKTEHNQSIKMIFDSISYIETYAKSHDRLSISLLYVFTNYKCIFLGLSMLDPNLLRIIVQSRQIRGDKSCWGMVFGDICGELKEILFSWGIAVIDNVHKINEETDYSRIPQAVISSMKNIDEPEIDDIFSKFQKLLAV